MKGIIIRSPDDMHFHPRSGAMLQTVLPYTSKIFSRGVAMGNLPKPVVTADDASRYQNEILSVDPSFKPIMTIMLTKETTPQIVKEAFDQGVMVLKYIPNNVSTNSEEGVSLEQFQTQLLFGQCGEVLKMAEELGMIFSGHWEAPFDVYKEPVSEVERETQSICFLKSVVEFFPKLKIVVEHATTHEMIEYVKNAPRTIGATLTVHHALLTYSDVCGDNGRIRNPHHYCKPIAKKPSDRNAVIKAMVSGNPKFFFGSDSAPHPLSAKEKTPPSAGIFTAPVALPLLCELFEQKDALPKLEDFVSRFGAEFYGLPLNVGETTLRKSQWIIPDFLGNVRIFRGGCKVDWQVC
ncbi:MAG: dihydroorotase [Candidatus Moranbacteria bacterium]|nr:dihydroorotase [Candidatus Moranbacteria bacterium]